MPAEYTIQTLKTTSIDHKTLQLEKKHTMLYTDFEYLYFIIIQRHLYEASPALRFDYQQISANFLSCTTRE